MQGALARFVTVGQMPTSRARTMVVVAVVGHDNRLGQVVDVDDALSRIGDIITGSEHGASPEDKGSDGWCRRHDLPCLARSQKLCYSVLICPYCTPASAPRY